jgi:uncharacterized protein (DUF486 family)
VPTLPGPRNGTDERQPSFPIQGQVVGRFEAFAPTRPTARWRCGQPFVHSARISRFEFPGRLRFPFSNLRMIILRTVILLTLSNVFMTFAWYAHLRDLSSRPWHIAAIASWGIALFEYLLQVPANRIGYAVLSLGQLKILQEAITLTVFVPFAVLYMKQPLKLDFIWAGLCLMGAVYFMFRSA